MIYTTALLKVLEIERNIKELQESIDQLKEEFPLGEQK